MRKRIRARARLLVLAVAGAVALVALPSPAPAAQRDCKQPRGKHEPPCNPALAASPWGASHRGSYAQGSSPFRGLESSRARTKHLDLPGIPISIQFSGRYDDGGRAAWGSLIDSGDRQALFKVDAGTGELIDLYEPGAREGKTPEGEGGITGAYNMLDRNGRFIVPRQRWLDVYKDSVKGDRSSPIKLRKRFRLPGRAFCGDADRLVGAAMTYEGFIAFATERGVVGTVPGRPTAMRKGRLRAVNLNEGRCQAPDDQLETVSNNIAVDERGGIYVVTSERMRRLNHDAKRNRLARRWSAPYDTGSEVSEIRLGAGSGSTPSLMGTGRRQDRFVAITDGQDLMHMALFWRGGVPKDFDGLGEGRRRRMACEFPVRFGDPDARSSLSEQSIAVRGYGTLHVNNALDYEFPPGLPDVLVNALAALRGGDPNAAPYGAERIDWNPRKQRCESVWAKPRISIPNGIPSISERSGLAYGIGQRGGEWGVRGLRWRDGRPKLFAPADNRPCSEQALAYLEEGGLLGILGPVLDELPRSCENSVYAATEIGPGRSIWTGTFLGLTIYEPRR
ncbi:MAG TPA: hypothetical protein VKA36_09625 [Solirubrobacterales bacterium]|nr:hypothetical protein [Solirubrobacterales bacterium]